MQVCSVYFAIASDCLAAQVPPGKHGKDYDEVTNSSEQYQRAAEKLAQLGISLQTSAGLSKQAYLDFSKVLFQDMKKAMGGTCTNIAILFKKYSDFCVKLSQDGDPRFLAWIGCIHAKQRTCGGP
jgi:hypothetical protein